VRPNLRVVLRMYDHKLATILHETVEIKRTLSMSAVAAEEFTNMIGQAVHPAH